MNYDVSSENSRKLVGFWTQKWTSYYLRRVVVSMWRLCGYSVTSNERKRWHKNMQQWCVTALKRNEHSCTQQTMYEWRHDGGRAWEMKMMNEPKWSDKHRLCDDFVAWHQPDDRWYYFYKAKREPGFQGQVRGNVCRKGGAGLWGRFVWRVVCVQGDLLRVARRPGDPFCKPPPGDLDRDRLL